MADRYTYLPSIGIFIIVAWGAAELFAKWRYQKIVLGISAGTVLAILLICTRIQVRHWQNSFTLYEHSLAVTKNNYIIHGNYGGILTENGQPDKAIEHLKKAMRIKPNNADIYYNLAIALSAKGEIEQAIVQYNNALTYSPHMFKANYNLGNAYLKLGQLNDAVKCYTKALGVNPDFPEVHYNMGNALFKQGKYEKAIIHYGKAVELKPEWREAQVNLSIAKSQMAIASWSESLREDPNQPQVHRSLGFIFHQQGNLERAIYHWNMALRLKPDWPEVLNNLAWILAAAEDTKFQNPGDAVRFAKKGCELTEYNRADFLDTLAVAYAAAGRFHQAIETAEKAIKLAEAAGEKKLAQEIQDRLELYKAGQPYR